MNDITADDPPGVYFKFMTRPKPERRRRTDIAGFAGAMHLASDQNDPRRARERLRPLRCNRLDDIYEIGVLPAGGYLDAALRGFFANGGQTCYVAPIEIEKRADGPSPPSLEFNHFHADDGGGALDRLARVDALSMIAAPDAHFVSQQSGGEEAVRAALIAQAERLGDRIALIDLPPEMSVTSENIPIPRSASGLAAAYWPWIYVADESPHPSGLTRCVPPSGHIAGTLARRDLEQGVFAPPANMGIEDAVDVTCALSPLDRALANNNGVNVIVALPGRGVRSMGARAWNDGQPQWLHVRRTLLFICDAIAMDTRWTVFEPHNEALWRAIERLTRTILFDLWRRGGLVGATDDEAYVVVCDATTNPETTIDLGQVVCRVELQFAQPAERISVLIAVTEGRVELLGQEPAHG